MRRSMKPGAVIGSRLTLAVAVEGRVTSAPSSVRTETTNTGARNGTTVE